MFFKVFILLRCIVVLFQSTNQLYKLSEEINYKKFNRGYFTKTNIFMINLVLNLKAILFKLI